jgi:hypothetical protein
MMEEPHPTTTRTASLLSPPRLVREGSKVAKEGVEAIWRELFQDLRNDSIAMAVSSFFGSRCVHLEADRS